MGVQFISQHKYMVGALALGGLLLFVLLRKKASGAQTTTAGVQMAGLPANVQQAQVQAGAAIQTAQLQASQQVNNERFQLALEAQKEAADYATAQLNAATSTAQQVNAIQGAQNLSTIQAGVQNNAISTQALVNQEMVQASYDTQLSNNATAIQRDQIAAATTIGTAQIEAGKVTTVAQVAAAMQTDIARTQAQAAVDLGALDATTQTVVAGYGRDVALAQIDKQKMIADSVAGLVRSGQLNKGGAGGANQIAAIAALTGTPQIASSAYGTATASLSGGNSIAGIIGSIGQAVKTGASAFFA
jgi:hypothetical protein